MKSIKIKNSGKYRIYYFKSILVPNFSVISSANKQIFQIYIKKI